MKNPYECFLRKFNPSEVMRGYLYPLVVGTIIHVTMVVNPEPPVVVMKDFWEETRKSSLY